MFDRDYLWKNSVTVNQGFGKWPRTINLLPAWQLNSFEYSLLENQIVLNVSFFEYLLVLDSREKLWLLHQVLFTEPAGIYVLKVKHRNTRTRCEKCSKLTIKTPERRVFIVNFEHISHLVLVILLLTFNRWLPEENPWYSLEFPLSTNSLQKSLFEISLN